MVLFRIYSDVKVIGVEKRTLHFSTGARLRVCFNDEVGCDIDFRELGTTLLMSTSYGCLELSYSGSNLVINGFEVPIVFSLGGVAEVVFGDDVNFNTYYIDSSVL